MAAAAINLRLNTWARNSPVRRRAGRPWRDNSFLSLVKSPTVRRPHCAVARIGSKSNATLAARAPAQGSSSQPSHPRVARNGPPAHEPTPLPARAATASTPTNSSA
eukprot:scaffold118936_cov28-Tisochrysis_lutea.AAC.5